MSENLKCQFCEELSVTLHKITKWRCSSGHINIRSKRTLEVCSNCGGQCLHRKYQYGIRYTCDSCNLRIYPNDTQ